MKYSIRDFAWLILAIGLGLGWYLDRSVLSAQRDAYAMRLHEVEERAGVDFDVSLNMDDIIRRDHQKAWEEYEASLLQNIEKNLPGVDLDGCDLEAEETPESAAATDSSVDRNDEDAMDSTLFSPDEAPSSLLRGPVKFVSAFDRDGRDFCEFCEKEFGSGRSQRRVYLISVGIVR